MIIDSCPGCGLRHDLADFPGISPHGNRFKYDITRKKRRLKDSFACPQEAYLALLKTKLETPTSTTSSVPKSIRLRDMAERWLERAPLAKSTEKHYRGLLERYIYPFFGEGQRVRDIRVAMVSDFVHYLREYRTEKGEPLAELTQNGVLTCLKRMLSRAVHDDVFSENGVNPVLQLDKDDKPKKRRSRRFPILTKQEARHLLEVAGATDTRWLVAICLALFAGLRQKEIINLTWNRIDFKRRMILVAPNEEIGFDVKTEDSEGWVPMVDELYDALWQLRKETEYKFGTHFVLATETEGTAIDRGNLHRYVQSICEKAGSPVTSLHPLRHNLATALIYAGADDNQVKLVMRHSSTQVTRTTYEHIRKEVDSERAARANLIGLAFGGVVGGD
jgi:integrase